MTLSKRVSLSRLERRKQRCPVTPTLRKETGGKVWQRLAGPKSVPCRRITLDQFLALKWGPSGSSGCRCQRPGYTDLQWAALLALRRKAASLWSSPEVTRTTWTTATSSPTLAREAEISLGTRERLTRALTRP